LCEAVMKAASRRAARRPRTAWCAPAIAQSRWPRRPVFLQRQGHLRNPRHHQVRMTVTISSRGAAMPGE